MRGVQSLITALPERSKTAMLQGGMTTNDLITMRRPAALATINSAFDAAPGQEGEHRAVARDMEPLTTVHLPPHA
jgi:hypothetical protein